MQSVDYVLGRVKAGDRVVFGRDAYGQQFVELWRGRLFERRSKLDCSPSEIRHIKDALLMLGNDASASGRAN
jgi:hypothetical protein